MTTNDTIPMDWMTTKKGEPITAYAFTVRVMDGYEDTKLQRYTFANFEQAKAAYTRKLRSIPIEEQRYVGPYMVFGMTTEGSVVELTEYGMPLCRHFSRN